MEYKVGDNFWKAAMTSGHGTSESTVETAQVTVTKITPLYYFIEPCELLFGCSTRLRKNAWDNKPIVYHTTERKALFALQNDKSETANMLQKDIVIIKAAIAKAKPGKKG